MAKQKNTFKIPCRGLPSPGTNMQNLLSKNKNGITDNTTVADLSLWELSWKKLECEVTFAFLSQLDVLRVVTAAQIFDHFILVKVVPPLEKDGLCDSMETFTNLLPSSICTHKYVKTISEYYRTVIHSFVLLKYWCLVQSPSHRLTDEPTCIPYAPRHKITAGMRHKMIPLAGNDLKHTLDTILPFRMFQVSARLTDPWR